MTVSSMIDTINIENGRLVIDPGDRTKQLQIFLEHTQIILLIAKNVKSGQFYIRHLGVISPCRVMHLDYIP